MLKRRYRIFKYPDGDIRLSIKFLDEKYQTLGEFFITEVNDFYPDIYQELEAVVTGQKEVSDFGGNMLNIDIGKEETEVYYQMDDESLGEPCFISTVELYKLVIEWKEMEDKMYRGGRYFSAYPRGLNTMTFYLRLNVKAIMKSKIHVSISLALMKLMKLKEFLELTNGVNK